MAVVIFLFVFALTSVGGALFVFPVLYFAARGFDSPTKVRFFAWILLVLFVVFSLLIEPSLLSYLASSPSPPSGALVSRVVSHDTGNNTWVSVGDLSVMVSNFQ